MLSGSRRCCLSTKAYKQRHTRHEQPCQEPLLFLYPRWFRAISAKPHSSDRTPTRSSQPGPVDLGVSRRVRESGHKSQAVGTVESIHNADLPQDTQAQGLSIAPTNRSILSTQPLNRLASRPRQSRSWEEWKRQETRHTPEDTMTSIRRLPKSLSFRHDSELRVRRVSSLKDVAAQNTRLMKRSAFKKLHDPDSILWAEAVGLLAQYEARPQPEAEEELELSNDTVFHLTGSIHSNAWIHPVRRGCGVCVVGTSSTSEEKCVLTLNGMPRAIHLTKRYLVAVEEDILRHLNRENTVQELPASFHYVLSDQKAHYGSIDGRRADGVEQPRDWTIRSFADHVETLVKMQIPRLVQRELYLEGERHNMNVAKVLENLFSDPQTEAYISARALNNALLFCCRHTEVSNTADVLFQKARHIGLPLQSDTFNILIEYSLAQNQFDRFRSLLASMQQIGITPDGMTWMALLRVTKSPEGRRTIQRHMRWRGLLNPNVQRHVVTELIRTEFAEYLRQERPDQFRKTGLDKFVTFMDENFLPAWLSPISLNHMLNVCAERRHWNIIPKLVELARNRGMVFDSENLTHLLKVNRHRGSIRDSIELLKSHFAKTVGRDDTFAIPTVFMTGWNSRFYNVCRVIWRYAASHAIITYTMQNVVTSSLIKTSDVASTPASHLWRVAAGKIIVGTGLGIANLEAQHRLQEDHTSSMKVMEWLSQWTPNDGTREKQLSIASSMLHQDLTAWKRYQPMRSQPLFDLLEEAYAKDCEWMQVKRQGCSSLAWMLSDAIDVPLHPIKDRNYISEVVSSEGSVQVRKAVSDTDGFNAKGASDLPFVTGVTHNGLAERSGRVAARDNVDWQEDHVPSRDTRLYE